MSSTSVHKELTAAATGANQNSQANSNSNSCGPSKNILTGYTMCPNWVFDTLLVEESPSVVKVVLYFNRNTTGRTDASGQRVEFKQATYGLIASRMNMSVRAVGEAMRTALTKGYLVQHKGEYGSHQKALFEGDFYGLNWSWPVRVMSSKQGNVPELAADSIPLQIVSNQNISMLNPTKTSAVNNLSLKVIETRQNLPTCINKAKNTQINKEIELELNPDPHSARKLEEPRGLGLTTIVNSTIKQEKPLKSMLSTGIEQPDPARGEQRKQLNQPAQAKPDTRRRGSSAVGQLITDLTREFGDNPALVLPNITRALNLWHKTTLIYQ